MKAKRKKELTKLAKRAGVKVLSIEPTRGSHIAFVVESPGGVQSRIICSGSPSNAGAQREILGDFRKAARK